METVNITVRMERQTRDDAARLFSELGVSTTQAINMFLKQDSCAITRLLQMRGAVCLL